VRRRRAFVPIGSAVETRRSGPRLELSSNAGHGSHSTDPALRPTERRTPGSFLSHTDVLSSPTVDVISPPTGSRVGGTSVVIAGAGFVEVKGVFFGGSPSALFTVNSEGQIIGLAPASSAAGAVDVTVTTVAGRSPTSGARSLHQYRRRRPARRLPGRMPPTRGAPGEAAGRQAGRRGWPLKIRTVCG
jgi:IPT/TIG domain